MPANLTAQYLAADARYRGASTNEEKIEALQEMLREIPKHKGTDHMQADIKKKISQVKKAMGKRSATARQSYEYHIAKEGAGQVILVGPPNAGKSSLLARLSNAEPEVADYPYTTRKPMPCMVPFENVQIQTIDTPPVSADFLETWLAGMVRNADLVVLLLDAASDDLLDDYEVVLSRLQERKLVFHADPKERFSPDGTAWKMTMIVCNKADDPRAAGNVELLRELVGDRFEIMTLSTITGEGVEHWLRRVFERLGVIRIYTKQRGKEPDRDDPVLLKRGATVYDFARTIHKDFAEKLRFAKLWGAGKYDGQMVNRDFTLSDEDVVEIHI